VIHRATLSSKFISLFYGEFSRDGSLVFCNAGHNPPLLWSGAAFQELDRGGLVLGPNPNARYRRGNVCLESGDAVVLFTDGIIERLDPRGDQYGLDRLKDLVRSLEKNGAQASVESIFQAVDAHAGGTPENDDMTAVVVRRV